MKNQPNNEKLQTKLDSVYESRAQLWIKYRDLLREAFGFEKFQQFRQFLQENFASKIKSRAVEIKKHPRFTSRKFTNPSSPMNAYDYSFSDINYNADTDVVYGRSVTWIEGGGGVPLSPGYSPASCDPEHSYCWNVLVTTYMTEPDGNSATPEASEGCDGYAIAYLYSNSEVESGDYTTGGEHAGEQNVTSNPYCGVYAPDYNYSNATVTVSKPKVDIFLNGTPITGTTRNVIVGQQISLTTQVTGGTSSNPQWTIPGTRIANYVVTYTNSTSPTSAIVTELTSQNLTQPTIDFYWLDGADSRQVQYSVTINNRPYTGKATFNVKRPTASITTTTGTVDIGTIQMTDFGATGYALHYGSRYGTPGISFHANATLPNGFTGDINWVQLVTSSRRTKTPINGQEQVLEGFGLDTTFPYGDPNTGEESDSPLQELSSPCDYSSVSANDNFTMYLFFKPSNVPGTSIYVPLRKVDWSWSGTGTTSLYCRLKLRSKSNTVNPTGVDVTELPEWVANITQFDFH